MAYEEDASKPERLPVRCRCGWVLPAGFQVTSPDDVPQPTGTVLLFACGNCGAWHVLKLGRRGGAITPNASGFGNMPSRDRTDP